MNANANRTLIQQRTQKDPNNLIAIAHLLRNAIWKEIVDRMSGEDGICYGTLVETFYHRAMSYTDDLPFLDELLTEWNSGYGWTGLEALDDIPTIITIRDLRDWIITEAEKFILAEN